MQKKIFILLSLFLLTLFSGCQTIKQKTDAIVEKENKELSQYIGKTSSQLKEKFSPIVNNAINKVQLTKYWEPILKKYNLLTLLTEADAINPDLEAYITQKTLDGLFLQITKEEKQIRENPSARVSDILQRVFGS